MTTKTKTIKIHNDEPPLGVHWYGPNHRSALMEAARGLKPGQYFFVNEVATNLTRGAVSSVASRESSRRKKAGIPGRVHSRTTKKGLILFCK